MTPAPRKRPNEFYWFILSSVLAHACMGVQGVIVPHLITNILGKPASYLGIVTSVGYLPALFLLVAGAMGDRLDGRQLLSWCYSLQAATYALFAVLLYFGVINFTLVL